MDLPSHLSSLPGALPPGGLVPPGKGSLFAFGEEERQVLLNQRLGDGSIYSYAWGHRPENWIKGSGIKFSDMESVRAALSKDYANWTPELRRIVEDFDLERGDEITPRALYMLPVRLQ